jgi:RNA polymerase sigma-70 factor (ECF subfamily)
MPSGLAIAPRPAGAPTVDFHVLYREQFDFVWRTAQKLGAQDSEVEDRVHDVFAIVVKQLPTYDPSRPVRLWLYGIIYRVMLNHRRKLSTHEVPTAELPELVSDDDPAARAEQRQGLSIARQIIDSLEIDRRVVLVMHDLDELSMPQIAEALEIPLNTAYSRLRLARRDFEDAARRRMEGGR